MLRGCGSLEKWRKSAKVPAVSKLTFLKAMGPDRGAPVSNTDTPGAAGLHETDSRG
jgi:hypothetical protein